MITYAQLKSIAEKNNCKVEINPVYAKPFDGLVYEDGKMVWKEIRTHLGFEIGVRNLYGRKGRSEWQWFWFSTMTCPETLEDDTELYFERRYSQVTGKCHKCFWERMNVHTYIREHA